MMELPRSAATEVIGETNRLLPPVQFVPGLRYDTCQPSDQLYPNSVPHESFHSTEHRYPLQRQLNPIRILTCTSFQRLIKHHGQFSVGCRERTWQTRKPCPLYSIILFEPNHPILIVLQPAQFILARRNTSQHGIHRGSATNSPWKQLQTLTNVGYPLSLHIEPFPCVSFCVHGYKTVTSCCLFVELTIPESHFNCFARQD